MADDKEVLGQFPPMPEPEIVFETFSQASPEKNTDKSSESNSANNEDK